MVNKKKTWEQQILNQIEEEEQVTHLGQNHPALNSDEHPNFKVFEFTPNRNLDGDNRYYLSGQDWSIMQQSSVLKATHDILGNRLGFNFTFEEWFKYWESGFDFGVNRTGTTGLVTNYPIKKVGETEGWRADKSTRPGYLEWQNPSPKFQPGFRVIEYWPDRSDTETSYVLSGSDRDIIQQILNIEWSGGGGVALQERDPLETSPISFKGQPLIRLWFRQSRADKDPNYQYVMGQLAFRLIGKTERWDLVDAKKTPYQKLTTTELTQISNRIVQQFATPTPYKWIKGKISSSYRDKTKGIQSFAFVNSEAQGRELYQKLLVVTGEPFDLTKLKQCKTENETEAFPIDPPNMNVLGKSMQGIRRRPYTPVYFYGAALSVESLSYNITLVKNQTVTFNEEKFTQAVSSF